MKLFIWNYHFCIYAVIISRKWEDFKQLSIWKSGSWKKHINALFSKKKYYTIGPFSSIQVIIFKICHSQFREYITE